MEPTIQTPQIRGLILLDGEGLFRISINGRIQPRKLSKYRIACALLEDLFHMELMNFEKGMTIEQAKKQGVM